MAVNQAGQKPAGPLAAGSEQLRADVLRVSRKLFGIAAVAVVALATTVGAMYVVHEETSEWVEESREISRLARTAYVLTIDRELALRGFPPPTPDASLKATNRTAAIFAQTMSALTDAAGNSGERMGRITEISEAEKNWRSSVRETLETYGGRPPAEVRRNEKLRFDVLRARLGMLASTEDRLYSERQHHERTVRRLSTGAILSEILILILVLAEIRRRVVSQARELMRQKNALESQAEELARSNEELAAAIEAKDLARVFAEEQAAEQAALLTAISEVFFVLDRDGRYQKIAPANDELLNKPREELLGRQVTEVLPGPVAALALSAITKALETGHPVKIEYPLDLQGRTIWFAGTMTPLAEERVLWVVRDVSETRMAAEALKESEARFRYLVEHSPQAVALHAEGLILYANPACASLLGFASADMLLGAPLLKFTTRESAPRLLESLASLGRVQTRAPTCECQFRRTSDARVLAVEVTSVPVTYNGRAGVISILHDVTERKQLEEQLAHQAFHDPLTNLANRVLFRDRVEHALQRAGRGTGSPAVLFIDLDNFKAVNDGLGHSAGDWLLIEVAARLSSCLRPADTVARLGGDEFAVLLDDKAADATDVAERILTAFRVPFSVQGTDIVVTMSIGIASLMPHQGADDVLRNADLALYRAKGEGKACAASYEPEMHVAALRRLELETELRRAIAGEGGAGRLMLYYQPIARLSTGRMSGFEALVRWDHPERGVLEPLDFISLAEETGLIVPLGKWVLTESCKQTRQWQLKYGKQIKGTGMSIMVGVNLSGRHLSHPELVHDVSQCLKASGLAPGHLVLEMTESMLVHDNRATLERLHALKALGVRLSIDDFGTGYSSLAYLERFPVDSLKMDRSFIAGLGPGTKSPLAEAVIGLGRILGLRVIAEGIETQEQWERLRSLGCALGQGFHISYPIPADAFEKLIATTAETVRELRSGRFPVGSREKRTTPLTGLAAIS